MTIESTRVPETGSHHEKDGPYYPSTDQKRHTAPSHPPNLALPPTPRERDSNLTGESRLSLRDPKGSSPGKREAGDAFATLTSHVVSGGCTDH